MSLGLSQTLIDSHHPILAFLKFSAYHLSEHKTLALFCHLSESMSLTSFCLCLGMHPTSLLPIPNSVVSLVMRELKGRRDKRRDRSGWEISFYLLPCPTLSHLIIYFEWFKDMTDIPPFHSHCIRMLNWFVHLPSQDLFPCLQPWPSPLLMACRQK